MSNEQPLIRPMEGGGSYNLHANIPAEGASLAVPLLEQAAHNITLNGSNHPVVIADYGSSQGKNSFAPMRAAIQAFRSRIGPDRPIFVTHIDQAENDFNTLFGVLHCDPERYSAHDPNVFPSAIGRSFYEPVLPHQYVDLGWSSYAAVWLSRIPALIPGHFMAVGASGDVRATFDRQSAEDWQRFLTLRAAELRPGGRLVVVLPGMSDDGTVGLEDLFNQANDALAELVAAGHITADARARMAVGAHPRSRSQLLAPFSSAGQFCGLSVEHCELSKVPDPAWADYKRDGNKEALVKRQTLFFRSIFVPSLASTLADEKARHAFADSFEQTLRRRLAERPSPTHSFVQTIVLAKQITPAPAGQK
jgi:hypothetical protein